MLPDRVSNPGPLTYESGALPIESMDKLILTQADQTGQAKIRIKRKAHIIFLIHFLSGV